MCEISNLYNIMKIINVSNNVGEFITHEALPVNWG